MASEHYLTIRLDPHYQQFLRKHFNCPEEIFEFPARSYFNNMIEALAVTKKLAFHIPETDPWAFKIYLPNFSYKNAAFFRYLTEVQMGVFKGEIKYYYDRIIQRRITDLMETKEDTTLGGLMKLGRKQCTLLLIDEYGFDEKDRNSFDRIYKSYIRWDNNQRAHIYQLEKSDKKVKC
ncbi:MAG TPA: hypothetical protein VFC67_09715 [Prolixibacteraceae bacterium]|nr:hypothetical protein [Prolixibacteraceae bacterium]